MRFDEVELEAVPLMLEDEPLAPLPSSTPAAPDDASLWRRALALFTDLSVFAALALALSPLLLVFSYYYFVGTWILWGKTIGGAIFDVRVKDSVRTVRGASLRWTILIASVSAAGLAIAFLFPR